jgi:hypothetical protein
MDKTLTILVTGTLAALVIFGAMILIDGNASANEGNGPGNMPRLDDEDRARDIALDFMLADETYMFDGMKDTLKVYYKDTVKQGTFEICAEFTSAHGGYGDRKDKMVTEALTPHKALIVVNDFKVQSAIMDGQWDMINEKTV